MKRILSLILVVVMVLSFTPTAFAASDEANAAADGLGELLPLLGAEILRNHDAGPDGNADEQNDHQVQDRPGTADRRQRIVPDEAADNDAVHRVVQLLGDIADQQRDGELQQTGHRGSDGHVLRAEQAAKTR